jgi:hypothetical protein
MFNEKLKGVYSPIVETELRRMAEYFEDIDKECYINGIRTMFGLTVPFAINFDDCCNDTRDFMFRCYERYTSELTPEESDIFGCYIMIGKRSLWIEKDGSKGVPVWVK